MPIVGGFQAFRGAVPSVESPHPYRQVEEHKKEDSGEDDPIAFEDVLNDEGGGLDGDDNGGGGGGGGGIRRQWNDDNEVKENGVDINDNDDDRGGKSS